MTSIRSDRALLALAVVGALAAGCSAAGATPDPSARPTPAAGPSARPGPPADWAAYEGWLRAEAAAGRFSGSVLAARAGRVVMAGGHGEAAPGTPATAATRYCVASLGKMFTAVAVGQLVERRKLAFTDPVARYVRGLPAGITIAQLLTHTAGLGDAALGRPDPPTTLAGLLARVVAAPPPSAPGPFAYSNDGYIVLGAVIERVTGRSYRSYVRENVFRPAGMTSTDVLAYRPEQVPGMAAGRPWAAPVQVGNPSGGAYSTVGDLFRFARALTGHRLLGAAMTATLLAGKVDAPRPGGPTDRYGYGFTEQHVDGVRIVGHNGGTPGYEGQLDIYPDRGWIVVVLTNQDRTLVPAIQRSERLVTSL
jgi:CubicO group peptidase (beta-lactamase class C family)